MGRYPTRAEYGWEPPDEPEPNEGHRKPPKPSRRGTKSTSLRARRPKPRPLRLRTPEWKLLRELVRQRAGYRCERCGQARTLDPHHRKLKSQGGADVASNLAAICRECHDWVHAHVETAVYQGWIVRSGADPAARAITRWDGRMVLLDDGGGYGWVGRP
jgi:hypothetical protein